MKSSKKITVLLAVFACVALFSAMFLVPWIRHRSQSSIDELRSAEAGDMVCFGYAMVTGKEKGEPIEWLVLENTDTSLLLCAKRVASVGTFSSDVSATWAESDVRAWLNTTFINCAFSLEQQRRIMYSDVYPDSLYENPEIDQGIETTDKVYLLSEAEALEYFPTDRERRARPVRIGNDSSWWLRTRAACVEADGSIYKTETIASENRGIRPVIRISLADAPDNGVAETYIDATGLHAGFSGENDVYQDGTYQENVPAWESEGFEQYADGESYESASSISEATTDASVAASSAASSASYEDEYAQPTAALCATPPDLSGLTEISVTGASASSTIDQSSINVQNDAILMFDGDETTSWQEGVSGYGIGETFAAAFAARYRIKYIGFKLGNWKNDKYYEGNAKPRELTIYTGNLAQSVTFTGKKEIEWVRVENAEADYQIEFEINDVYYGTTYEDTCIAEIIMYGEYVE